MHIRHENETNAFVLVSSSESPGYDSRELGEKGRMARPTLFAWLRIAPVLIAEMPEVTGAVHASWNELHPTVDQKVETASLHMARILAIRFRPIVARSYYDFDFLKEYSEKNQNRMAFCARCVPTSVLADQVPLADRDGLYVPVAENQLRQIHQKIIRGRKTVLSGRPHTFTLAGRIWVEDARINLDFNVSLELCEFALDAMKYFGDELMKLRRERLKKSNKMVFRSTLGKT